MNQPVVLDGVRQQPGRQQSCRARPERTQPQPVLHLGGMAHAIPFGGEIGIDRLWQNIDLFSDECQQRFRGPLAGAERAARMAQVAEHQRMTEAVVIAPAPPDRREVGLRQRIVTHQFMVLGGRIEHRHVIPAPHRLARGLSEMPGPLEL